MIFFYVALFQLNPTRTIAHWHNSTLHVGYVLMLLLISLLMVAERMMYLYRSIVMKTLVHVSWVIFVVVMIHSNVYTDIFRLEGGESLRWFAYIQLPYFFFSSLFFSVSFFFFESIMCFVLEGRREVLEEINFYLINKNYENQRNQHYTTRKIVAPPFHHT